MISIKKVAKLCRDAGYVRMHTTGNRQWVGTMRAMYSMKGMPEMNAETVLNVLEFSEKQMASAEVEYDRWREFEQYREFPDTGEDIPVTCPITVGHRGNEYGVFLFGGVVMMVDNDYFKPIKTKEPITLHVRRDDNGEPVIAVKEGMLLSAVLWPDAKTEEELAPIVRKLAAKMSGFEGSAENGEQEEIDTGEEEGA